MRFLEIFRFELGFQSKRIVPWIYLLAVLCLSAVAITGMTDNVYKGDYFLDSPLVIASTVSIISLFSLALTAAISGNIAVRDTEAILAPLFYTTSLTKVSYLGGRFIACFLINLLVILIGLGVLVASSFLPGLAELFIGFEMKSYVEAIAFIALPNAFIFSAVLFAIALMTRKAAVGYLTAAALFFLALFSMDLLAGEMGMWELGKKLDLSGLTALKESRLVRTPQDLKTGYLNLSQSLVENRLIWSGFAASLLVLVYRRFSFSHKGSGKSRSETAPSMAVHIESAEEVLTPTVYRSFGLLSKMKQFLAIASSGFREILKTRVWLLLPAIAVFLVIISEEMIEGQLGVPVLPTTWTVLQLFDIFALRVVLAVLLGYYAGELFWRERDCRIDELTDTAPVPDWMLLLGKMGSLALLILLFQIMILIAGISVQILQGYSEFRIDLYVPVLLGTRLTDLLLLGFAGLGIQILINQKYMAHLVFLCFYFYTVLPGSLGVHHNLLIFGGGPTLDYNGFNGFGPDLVPWIWFRFYWICWVAFLMLAASALWNRGKESSLGKRSTRACRSSNATIASGVGLLTLILITGGYIFYNTNVLNHYATPLEITQEKVAYEKRYGRFRNVPQPMISGIKLEGEIYPRDRMAYFSGEYTLVNRSNGPLDSIHISTDLASGKFSFSRKAENVLADARLGYTIYRLQAPLQQGDSLLMGFKVLLQSKGFSNSGVDNRVVRNGTYFDFNIMPDIGYDTFNEVTDTLVRNEHNLGPRLKLESVFKENARQLREGSQPVRFEAVLGTSENQIAVTAGTLQKSWISDGRRYFHYKTDVPIRMNIEFLSAEYQVRRSQWKDVNLEILHLPGHDQGLDHLADGMENSLAYFSEIFSPYQHEVLRLVEYPGKGGLNGNPVTMSYSESFYAMGTKPDRRAFDFPFAVIGHEVAHQWWGNTLSPAPVEGAPLLTESLAWYSAMLVVEKVFGVEALKRLVLVMRQEYLTPRSPADVPLIRASDKFEAYRKGPFAMFGLKGYLGEQKINKALRRLQGKFKPEDSLLPVSLDLVQELKQVTPDSLGYLLKDFFIRNTYWDLKAEKAIMQKISEGVWEISFEFTASKSAIDQRGSKTVLPMEDYIEIGLYGKAPEGRIGDQLYLRKHRISSGKHKLQIRVKEEPGLVAIDPNRLLIDQNIEDNYFIVGQTD